VREKEDSTPFITRYRFSSEERPGSIRTSIFPFSAEGFSSRKTFQEFYGQGQRRNFNGIIRGLSIQQLGNCP
jgi:hypothetical protein